jgi:HK97 family phage prohead protease
MVNGAGVRTEKRADGASVITGYGSVFYDGSPGTEYDLGFDMVERIMPGAFDRAISENQDVRGLFNHEACAILGRTASGTMKLSIDAKGLRYEITPPDTQLARDLMASIGRGDISGSSFSFVVTTEEWRMENNIYIREVRAVDLYDVGPVTYPAYTGTNVGTRAKGDSADARESRDRWERERNARLASIKTRARIVEIELLS